MTRMSDKTQKARRASGKSGRARSRNLSTGKRTFRDSRRRLEQFARNPHCEANCLSAIHGVAMGEVARSEGIEPSTGQSPFALARGRSFERELLSARASRLRQALEEKGVLPTGSTGFLDLRTRQHGGPLSTQDEALLATKTYLQEVADEGGEPTIVAGATVSLPGGLLLPEAILVLDALVVRPDLEVACLMVGEVKTYPDRGGHTDGGHLATARAQGGVYVLGLREVCEGLGLTGRIEVSERGFLVLSRPGSNYPSVRPDEDLRYQVRRAERGFERLRDLAARVPACKDEKSIIASVAGACTAYCEECVSFCDLAPRCHAESLAAGDPSALGGGVSDLLGTVSISRAAELLGGAAPAHPHEAEVLQVLQRSAGGGAS